MSRYVTKMFDRLDRIVNARYGTTEGDLVVFVIERNPGLEDQPLVLPLGLSIELPDLPVGQTTRTIKQIQLWD